MSVLTPLLALLPRTKRIELAQQTQTDAIATLATTEQLEAQINELSSGLTEISQAINRLPSGSVKSVQRGEVSTTVTIHKSESPDGDGTYSVIVIINPVDLAKSFFQMEIVPSPSKMLTSGNPSDLSTIQLNQYELSSDQLKIWGNYVERIINGGSAIYVFDIYVKWQLIEFY